MRMLSPETKTATKSPPSKISVFCAECNSSTPVIMRNGATGVAREVSRGPQKVQSSLLSSAHYAYCLRGLAKIMSFS